MRRLKRLIFIVIGVLFNWASAHAQTQITTAQIIQWAQQVATPANPPTGSALLYLNQSGNLACLTPTGGSCLSAGGSGTVTSVTFTGDGTVLSSTPSSAVTTSGTLTGALANAGANTVLGNATSGSAAPAYGQIVNGQITNGTINLTTKVTGVLPPANGGVAASSTTVGGGGFWGALGIENMPQSSGTFTTETGDITGNNVVRIWEFTLPTQQTVGHMNWNISTLGSATGTITYDLGIACGPNNASCTAGTVLVSTGGKVISGTGNQSAIPTQATQVTLNPGTYYFFDCGNATSNVNTVGQVVIQPPVAILGTTTLLMNVNGTRYGTAANSCNSGVAQATLGALTKVNSNAADPIAVYFEP